MANTGCERPKWNMSRDAAIMANSTNPNTPWTVRTTKRKARASAPQPEKRQRLSCNDRNVPRSRQQTLTQIQFGPYIPSPSKLDELCPIEIMASRTSKERRKPSGAEEVPEKPGAARTRKGPKKQRSTLTQMDFLTLGSQEYDMKENIDPNTANTTTRAKRKAGNLAEQRHNQARKRRKEVTDGGTSDDIHLRDRTPRAIGRSGLQGQALSEQMSNVTAPDTAVSTRTRKTRATTTETDGLLPQVESHDKSGRDAGGDVDLDSRRADWAFLKTPHRTRDVIPSSQSPESVSISTRRRSVLRRQEPVVSPLEERSRNVTPSKSLGARRSLGFDSGTNGFSPKRKICVLKYGPGRFEMPDLSRAEDHDLDEGDPTVRKLQAVIIGRSRCYTEGTESDVNVLNAAQDLVEPEIAETSQADLTNVIPSSQTDSEDEAEIPETSQGLRRVTSTPSLNRSEESLQMLSNTHHTPGKTTKQRCIERHDQPDAEANVELHDFGSNAFEGGCDLNGGSPSSRQSRSESGYIHQRLPAKLPRLQSGISTIGDSQDEDHDDNDLLVKVPATTTDGSRLFSASARPDLPPPTASNSQSSPSLLPAPPPSYPPATITRIPTKLPPISSPPSSSPNLPPPPRPTTQQSIRPASLPRPSQVSTQASTIQSWLPMSSMPFANSARTSLPSHHHSTELDLESHVTIKDSSSSSPSVPLRDIPSQPRSQVEAGFAMVNLGLGMDDDDGDEDFDARDEDLDPKSSPQQSVDPGYHHDEDEEEEEEEGENNDDDGQSPSPSRDRTHANRQDPTSNDAAINPIRRQGDPPHLGDEKKKKKKKKKANPVSPSAIHQRNTPPLHSPKTTTNAAAPPPPPPLTHHPAPAISTTLNLPDSLLESLPAPPGWACPSQQDVLDWEDEML